MTLFKSIRHWVVEPIELDRQYGAIPYRFAPDGRLEVLLVTSRGRGQWIVPKGGRMAGREPWEVAQIEASEEAGVMGEIGQESVGSYVLPVGPSRARPVKVMLYPLLVTHEASEWKEMHQRQRRWVTLGRAQSLVPHSRLAAVIRRLRRAVPGEAVGVPRPEIIASTL